MAETIGSLVDKLSIIELKIFHMKEQLDRKDVDDRHREACLNKIGVMNEQKADLRDELNALAGDVVEGRKKMKVYRQFKMYNDPAYRAEKEAPSA